MFEIGEDVVHVPNDGNDTPQDIIDEIESEIGKIKWPIEDNCYTVRGYNAGGGLLLQEIIHPLMRFDDGKYDEIGFEPTDFVRLDKLTKTEFAEATDILTNHNVGEYKMFP